jgi:DNA-binding transcriptional LysR family regulator
MLDLSQLETFRVAAATKNFTRAAGELGCSQSTVTLHVKALERELGVRLFERRRFSKNVVLTEAGHRTLEYANRLLTLADEIKAATAEADAAVFQGR